MARRSRRRFVQVSLAGIAVGLAGCGMPGGEGDGEEGGEEGDEEGEEGGEEGGEDENRAAPEFADE
ncbi:hypothetical protein [Halorussus lipolyticus]|uniref:hypothetical protein n=1 Tax=Halorussus lipolyticus TaxID=3034024 RepID=UPI0023E8E7EE|nr:hypothetical protein [Halorussus sp. DT80]